MPEFTIDLRSDTVTQPTEAMRRAMATCEVGDDVVREDPTINELERYASELLGKPAALFTPSGTFANQCALLTHAGSGNEVIVEEDAHIVQHEAGAAALIARVQLRTLIPANGAWLLPEEIRPRIRMGEDIHYPKTALIVLTQATAMGRVIPLDVMESVYALARETGVAVHIDGARLFNAAVALEVEPEELARCGDTVCICLSKGLCAPVGSLLAGPADFIERARRNRKILGGGMRQAGFLAAAGLLALQEMRQRLAEDHANARLLEKLLKESGHFQIARPGEINMVFARREASNIGDDAFVSELEKRGVRIYPPEYGEYRFVTHHGIGPDDLHRALEAMRDVLG